MATDRARLIAAAKAIVAILREKLGSEEAVGRALRYARRSTPLRQSGDAQAAPHMQSAYEDFNLNQLSGAFDPILYERAKPLFEAAISCIENPREDIREAMRTVIRMVLDKFGRQAAQNMKPYVIRFFEDLQSDQSKSGVSVEPPVLRPTLTAGGVETKDYLIRKSYVSLQSKKSSLNTESNPRSASAARNRERFAVTLLVVVAALVAIQVGAMIPDTAHVVIEREGRTYFSDRCVSGGLWDSQEKLTVLEAKRLGFVRNVKCVRAGGFADDQMLLARLIFGPSTWK